jgi:hypothetical protein
MPPGVLKNRTTTSALSAPSVRLALFLACGTLPSCGEPPAPAAPPHAPPPSTPPPSDAQARYGAVALASPPGTILLYDPEHWRARRAGSFTVLEHPSSRSTLAIRLWRAARLVRPADVRSRSAARTPRASTQRPRRARRRATALGAARIFRLARGRCRTGRKRRDTRLRARRGCGESVDASCSPTTRARREPAPRASSPSACAPPPTR